MVPSIGQYGKREERKERTISCSSTYMLSVASFKPMSFSVSPDHVCVYEPCSCFSQPPETIQKLTPCFFFLFCEHLHTVHQSATKSLTSLTVY